MTAKTTGNLRVSGARLYFEVRGAGPVLLLIHGSIADCGVYGPVAGLLAEHYTVVTYDRRGYVRSPLDEPARAMVMAEQTEDARLILDEVGARSAFVLGSSGGAVIALDLLAAHPDRVSGLIAHEPPVLSLLPDGAQLRAFLDGLDATCGEHGVQAAADALLARMLPEEQGQPEFEPGFDWDPALPARMAANSEFWFTREAEAGFAHTPDLAALKAAADKLVLGVGEDSAGWPAARSALALGAATGARVVSFPGGHTGYLVKPRAFAEFVAPGFAALSPPRGTAVP
ncbi:alpha/beta hydrolase [Actinospica durhamensis]|uniref:Alpha/beta hydrolase n=1 Tax=Actinospica durhamensis TaxID=1508375 RepID=A0A941ERK9_9ACTN|nr:alpha/beta hydrolase [Actinospica durhamensis]MBR7832519.1 alpha/beta hydrolase [Actinospica durhamensis]